MKRIYTLIGLVLFSTMGMFAQEANECDVNLSLEHDYAKARRYDQALPYWEKVYKDCPKHSEAIYSDGTKIFKAKFKAAVKVNDTIESDKYYNKIIQLYDQWLSYFPTSKYVGKIYQEKGLMMLNNKKGSKAELYQVFNDGFTKGKSKFSNPKALYGYFDAAVEMYKNKKLSFDDLINLYDEIGASIETSIEKYTLMMEDLQKKQDAGELMKTEERKLKAIRNNIPVYTVVAGEMDKILGELGDCEHLVPLYKRTYEENKDNAGWLRKAARNLSNKDCSNAPVFKKLVVQLDNIEPSYSSAYYLAIMYKKEGNTFKAKQYFLKAIDLADKAYDKAKIYFALARMDAKSGRKSSARSYANKALANKPSMGSAYLLIASLYASSANQCGTDEFSKRATYWLAASMADKAARVDPSNAKRARKKAAYYRTLAPTKSDIFIKNMAGKTVLMKCWIGTSVKVPK